MNVKKLSNIAIATAAASMFAMAVPMTASAGEDAVHCHGVNSCKGTSACKTANSACKGQNSCKGQGFLSLSEAECTEQGGSTEEAS